MAKNISVAKQILGILEDARRPLFLLEIVEALGEDFNSIYVQPSVCNLLKIGAIKSSVKIVPAIKGEKKLKIYSLNDEKI